MRFNNAIVPDVTYARLIFRKAGQLSIPGNILNTNSGSNLVAYCNDPFDPDPDVGNKFAQGFDYFRDFYQSYIVVKAKIRVDWTNLGRIDSSTSPWGTTAYVLPQLGGTVQAITNLSPVDYIQNLPRIKWRTMSAPGANKQRCSIRHEWTLRKDQAALNRGNFWEGSNWAANTTGSPVNRRALYLVLGTANGAGNTSEAILSAQYKLTILYYCRFYGRKVTPELDDPE